MRPGRATIPARIWTPVQRYESPSGVLYAGAIDSRSLEYWGGFIQGVEPMNLLYSVWAWLHRDEEGQGLAEYALILALIAILAIVALLFLGGQISKTLSTVGNSM
jgi:pilus assembly protein Flp/PilA